MDDNEVPDEFQDFSDDEVERNKRKQSKYPLATPTSVSRHANKSKTLNNSRPRLPSKVRPPPRHYKPPQSQGGIGYLTPGGFVGYLPPGMYQVPPPPIGSIIISGWVGGERGEDGRRKGRVLGGRRKGREWVGGERGVDLKGRG